MNKIQLMLLAGFSFAATNVYGQKNDAQAIITASEAAKMHEPVLVTENQNIMTSQEMVALQSNRGQSETPGNKQPVQVPYNPLTPSRETMGKDLRQNMSEPVQKPD